MDNDLDETYFSPVRNTGQLYIPQAITDNPKLGFEPGDDDVRLRVLDCGALLAWPAGDLPTDTLTVPPPDPAEIPWPISTTGATIEDLVDDADRADD